MKYAKRIDILIPIVLFTGILLSCISQQVSEKNITIPADNTLIAFIHLKMYYPDGKISIKYISGSLHPGRLKESRSLADTMPLAGYLLCVIKDENGNEIKKIVTENPLVKNIEFLNSGNVYERKIVKMKEADLFLRFQYKGDYKRLSVNIFDDNLFKEELSEFELR